MNIFNISLGSTSSSLKIMLEDSEILLTPAGVGANNTITVPHGYGSDLLIPHVIVYNPVYDLLYTSPYYQSNGDITIYTELDSVNLYMMINLNPAAIYPALGWECHYRLLIP